MGRRSLPRPTTPRGRTPTEPMPVFCTEYIGFDGWKYGGDIEAETEAEAQDRCVERGLGERVLGELVCDINDETGEVTYNVPDVSDRRMMEYRDGRLFMKKWGNPSTFI